MNAKIAFFIFSLSAILYNHNIEVITTNDLHES